MNWLAWIFAWLVRQVMAMDGGFSSADYGHNEGEKAIRRAESLNKWIIDI